MQQSGSNADERRDAARRQSRSAEGLVQKQNKFFKTVLNSLEHPFCVIDVRDYTVKLANSKALPRPLPAGLTCHQLFHDLDEPCDIAERPCPIRRVKKERAAITVEHVRPGPDGKARHLEVHAHPLFDSAGTVTQVIEYSVDITERKRAQRLLAEEHRLLQGLINGVPDLVYIKDLKGRFVLANTGVARFMGVAGPDELTGKTDFDFYPEDVAAEFYQREQQIVRSGRPLINEPEFAGDKNSPIRWVLTTKVPWEDSQGNIVGIMGVGRDITELKRTQEALEAANQQLEATNQQLQASEQQLKAANQQLGAGEQQLKAANQQLGATNQQLRASEQQLRAANQQLQATEQQFRAANQQLQATEQQFRAANQQLRANEQDLRRLNHDLYKRMKELNCLYGLFRLDRDHAAALERILEGLVELMPSGWECPDIAVARIVFEGREFKSANFRETAWSLSAPIIINEHKAGVVQICYLKESPQLDEGAFLLEERSLLDALAEHISEIAERKVAEQKLADYQAQLKSLASQLSLTEEKERRRIATELHDRIGQHLVISKVRLESLKESAPNSEFALSMSEICASLEQVIRNSRSLTFDLSSPILHELGFEAAVAEWLADQIEGTHGIETEFEDDGKPKLLSEDLSILLFRDVRELLINVVKHANAKKVTVRSRRVGNQIHVSIADDGVGFDPSDAKSLSSKTGGFGLFSIRERLEQVGGRLKIETVPGKGTKVTIIAPLGKVEIDDEA